MYNNNEINQFTVKLVLNQYDFDWEYNEPEVGSETYDLGYDFTLKISKFTCYINLEEKIFTLGVDLNSLNEDETKRFTSKFGTNYNMYGTWATLNIRNIRYVGTLRSVIKDLLKITDQ